VLAALTALLGFVVKASSQWTQVKSDMTVLRRDLTTMTEDKHEAHTALYQMMKDDRAATNDRLTYLERKMART
jgi:hypothetical protein